MEYEDFELQLGPRRGEGVLARVLRSPAGQGESMIILPRDFEDSASWPRDLSTSTPATLSPSVAGGRLFRALFTSQVGDLFYQSLSAIGPGRGLRIRLHINPRDRGSSHLHRVPWEILYREDTEDFLALSRSTPVVRSLDVARPTPSGTLDSPLRILIVLSQAPGTVELDLSQELARLQASLLQNREVRLEVLDSPDSTALRRALSRTPFDVLHFMGHGTFDPATGEGALLFRGPDNTREAISGRHLATKIKDLGTVRLVVLNACETALDSAHPQHSPSLV